MAPLLVVFALNASQVREMGMTGGAGFLLDRPTYRAPETFLSLPEDTRS